VSDRKLTISLGSGEKLPNNAHLARITGVEQLTWAALVSRLTQPPPVTADKASAGWYCCAEFRGRHRDTENFIARHCLALDYDHITRADVASIRNAFRELEYVMYTTASHTPSAPRLRVVMPLSRPATADEFQAVSRKVAACAGIELASRESHVPAQMMYLPTVKPGGAPFKSTHTSGSWVNVDGWLAEYKDWTDRSQWPARREHDALTAGESVDPTTKPGVIGAFCRAIDCVAAIERFDLPYVRVR
jgi:putative DNA primase/helicase